MKEYDLIDVIASARESLYEYEYIVYTGMISDPIIVVNEMEREIIKLRLENDNLKKLNNIVNK